MTEPNTWVERYRSRLRWAEILRHGADVLAIFLFLLGGLVLATRLAAPRWWPEVLYVLAGVIPLAAVLLVRSQRYGPTDWEAAALLDRRLEAGGLLMTLMESRSEEWLDRLPRDAVRWRECLPRIRWGKIAKTLILPLAFVGGACLAPLREARTELPPATIVGQQATQELEQMLELLETAQVLNPRDQQEVREELERLATEARQSPLTNEKWEAIDSIRDRLAMRVQEAAQETMQARQALATLAGGTEADGESLTVERQAELEEKLVETLRQLSQSGRLAGVDAQAKTELQRLVQTGEFRLAEEPEARAKQLEELREYLDQESQNLQQLRRMAGLSDENSGGLGEDGVPIPGGGGQGGDEIAGAAGEGAGSSTAENGPGQEGGRGGGPAGLREGGSLQAESKRFKDVVLPPGFLDGLGTQKVGESRTAPIVEPGASSASGGRREFGPAVGGETWTRQLQPRHRGVIREYFRGRE